MSKKNKEEIVYLDKRGMRADGRKIDELRPIKMEVGVLPRADGSAYIEWGQNKIYAAVYGPKECVPKHMASPYKAVLRYYYRMATFSVPDRKNPRPGRREIEIGKVSKEALESVVMLEKFPEAAIDVSVEVIDSNAGTRVAALTAASLALVDAGLPMKDIVSAVSVGRIGGHVMLDLTKDEEDADDAVDIPIAVLHNTDEIALMQLDGLLTKKELDSAMELALKGCKQVYEMQKEALKRKYVMEASSEKETKAEKKKEHEKEAFQNFATLEEKRRESE